jgi:tellurite resistance protein TerC
MHLPPDHPLQITYAWAKRIVIVVAGFTVLIIGVVMIVTPGPAIVVIPIGLGILSLEFAWAKRWLEKLKAKGRVVAGSLSRGR